MDLIKLVVIDEHTLGYIFPQSPDTVNILHTSILRGSRYSDRSVIYVAACSTARLASEKDFDQYRVSFQGFNNRAEYEFAG